MKRNVLLSGRTFECLHFEDFEGLKFTAVKVHKVCLCWAVSAISRCLPRHMRAVVTR